MFLHLYSTVMYGSNFFTIAIGIERYIAVHRPLRLVSIMTYERSLRITAGIFIFIALLQIPIVIILVKFPLELPLYSNYQCYLVQRLLELKLEIIWVVHLLLFYVFMILVPTVSILLINLMIICKVHFYTIHND